jgi:predicted O-methyltransferase YrrM
VTVPESTYTGARAFCPRPDLWHAHDIQATEVEVTELVGAMVRATQPEHVLETGTYRGHTAQAIGRALAVNGHGRLYTIEHDKALAGDARRRCLGLPVIVVNGDTLSFCPAFPIDFAWFDSGDEIRGDEFRRFHRFMHERTVVGFHDAGPQHRVFEQVEALVAEGLLARPLLIHSPRGVCFANVLGHGPDR